MNGLKSLLGSFCGKTKEASKAKPDRGTTVSPCTNVENHTNQIIQPGMHCTITVHVLLYVPWHTDLSNNRHTIPSLCGDILHVVVNNNKNQHTPHAEGDELSPV